MKRFVAIVLIIAIIFPVTLIATEAEAGTVQSVPEVKSSSESLLQGRFDARTYHSTGGWVAGGIIGGGLFSLLGTGVVTLFAMSSSPQPHTVPDDVQIGGYTMGYTDEARKRNTRSAGIAGLLMSTIWIVYAITAF